MAQINTLVGDLEGNRNKIINFANVICKEYADQGYDLSLRQLYYQFVARGLLENSDRSYKRLGGIISDARLTGNLDWDFIKDRGRKQEKNSHWDSPSQIIEVCARQFRIDLWSDQDYYILVMVEKQALEGVLVPVCNDLDVPFIANKGYSSSSTMYEIGQQCADMDCGIENDTQRQPIIIYLGDHDPSGIDMTRDVKERLELFAGCEVIVERVALNMDQVEEYNPPPNPAKLTDSRASEYISHFGNKSWELDALEPSLLASLVRDKVGEYRDDEKFDAKVEEQDAHRDRLNEIAESIK